MAGPEVNFSEGMVMATGLVLPFLSPGMIFGTSRSAE
jgi:hypothetical protein